MYFLRRILFFVPLLLVISMLSFGLLRLAPGGPFDRERAPASAEIERLLRARLRQGLLHIQQQGRSALLDAVDRCLQCATHASDEPFMRVAGFLRERPHSGLHNRRDAL